MEVAVLVVVVDAAEVAFEGEGATDRAGPALDLLVLELEPEEPDVMLLELLEEVLELLFDDVLLEVVLLSVGNGSKCPVLCWCLIRLSFRVYSKPQT